MQGNRPVILHFHIFKNAGTTVDWALQKNFGEHAASIDDTTSGPKILPMSVILDYLKEHPETKSVSSHQIRPPLPQADGFLFIPIVFIRHPIDRAFSIYSFNKRRTDKVTEAKDATLTEYVKWALGKKYFTPLKNFQTIFLSGKNNRTPATPGDLPVAKKRLKDWPIVGVVERVDESLVLAEEMLRPHFENIDMSYIKQNVTPGRKDDLAGRMEGGKAELGELFDELVERNSLDFELHSFANQELDRRLKGIENLEKKLGDFRDRCSRLAAPSPPEPAAQPSPEPSGSADAALKT
jgi:hypothetical protein